MKKILIMLTLYFLFFFFSSSVLAWQWTDIWKTQDQKADDLLRKGKAQEAAALFHHPDWQAVARYRAGNYEEALKHFNNQNTSDGQYNAGNAAAYLGRYKEAIAAYDKAIAINPQNKDAIINRDIIKKLLDKKNHENQQKQNQNNQNQQNQSQQASNDTNKSNESKESNKTNDSKKLNESNNSAENKEKQNTQNKSEKNASSQKEERDQDKSAEKRDSEKKPGPSNSPNEMSQNDKPQTAPISTPSSTDEKGQQQTKNPPDNLQKEQRALSNDGQRNLKDENQKQMLRRVVDNPGGLLQQKFLRDYIRRHADAAATLSS